MIKCGKGVPFRLHTTNRAHNVGTDGHADGRRTIVACESCRIGCVLFTTQRRRDGRGNRVVCVRSFSRGNHIDSRTNKYKRPVFGLTTTTTRRRRRQRRTVVVVNLNVDSTAAHYFKLESLKRGWALGGYVRRAPLVFVCLVHRRVCV